MMPEKLLDEFEGTATSSGIRSALICAYQAGEADALNGALKDVMDPSIPQHLWTKERREMEAFRQRAEQRKPPVDNSFAAANLDMHLQSRGGCFNEPE